MSVSTPTFDLCVPRLVATVREVLPQADFVGFRVVRDMHGRLYLSPSHSRGCCWAGLKLPTGSFAHQDPHLWRKRLLANA